MWIPGQSFTFVVNAFHVATYVGQMDVPEGMPADFAIFVPTSR